TPRQTTDLESSRRDSDSRISAVTIKRIAVLGAGTMGHGIAYAAATAGFETAMYDVTRAAVEKGRAAVEQVVRKGVDLGKVTAADADATLARLTISDRIAEALAGADFV